MSNSLTSAVHDLRIIALPKPFWYHLEREVAWIPFLHRKPFFPETDWLEKFQIFNFACESFFLEQYSLEIQFKKDVLLKLPIK